MAYTVYYDTPGTILTYDQVNTAVSNLATAEGWTYQSFGQSERGRDINGVIINGGSYAKTVLIDGGIHGNETWGVRSVVDFLNYMAAQSPAIYTSYRFVVVPIVNPDGYVAGTRKNNNNLDDDLLDPWPRTVDLNRNFSIGWGLGSASTDPANDNYQGPEAESESETDAMVSLLATYGPHYHITVHTPLDIIICGRANHAVRQVAVSSALATNEFTNYDWTTVVLSGQLTNYSNSLGIEAYNIELNTATTIHEEVNRYICSVLAFMDSFDSESLPATNDFSGDANCKAWWRFNTDGIGYDAMGSDPSDTSLANVLTSAGCVLDETNFVEGDASAYLNRADGGDHLRRTDTSLLTGFPLKSSESNKAFGATIWIRPEDLPANTELRTIYSKYDAGAVNKRCFALFIYNDAGTYYLRANFGYASGVSIEPINTLTFSPVVDTQYMVAFTFDDSDKSWHAEVWDDTEQLATEDGTYTNAISLTTAPFVIGGTYTGGSIYTGFLFDGRVDECAIFAEKLSSTKIASIWAGTYGASGGGASVTPSKGTLTLTGKTPTVSATANQSVTAGKGALSLAGYAPTVSVSNHISVAPSQGALTLSSNAATVAATDHKSATPPAGELTATGQAPTVVATAQKAVTPDAGTLTLTGQAPTVVATANQSVTPDAVALSLTGYASTVTATGAQAVTVPSGALLMSANVPTVEATAAAAVTPTCGSLALSAEAATITASDHKSAVPEVGELAVTGQTPTATATAHVSAAPLTGALAVTGYAPTPSTTADQYVNPGAGSLSVTGHAPTLDSSGFVSVIPIAGTLTLTGLRPDLKGYGISWISTTSPAKLYGADSTVIKLHGSDGNAFKIISS
jgi:predicted secreted Zn-dependent protease